MTTVFSLVLLGISLAGLLWTGRRQYRAMQLLMRHREELAKFIIYALPKLSSDVQHEAVELLRQQTDEMRRALPSRAVDRAIEKAKKRHAVHRP